MEDTAQVDVEQNLGDWMWNVNAVERVGKDSDGDVRGANTIRNGLFWLTGQGVVMISETLARYTNI